MKILRLTLNKKWFDMIQSGEKKEEYREIKSYWIDRLTDQKSSSSFVKPMSLWKFNKYYAIEFVNGYSPNSPRFLIKCNGIEIGAGNTNWGAVPWSRYFKIKLGEIINENK